MAGFLAAPHLHYVYGYENDTPGVLLLCSVVAESLAQLGWTKQKIREFLWEHSRLPGEQMNNIGAHAWLRSIESQVVRDSAKLDPWPITARPENIAIVVSGGGHSSNAYWMQADNHAVIGRTITVPDDFESLLAEAKRDMTA